MTCYALGWIIGLILILVYVYVIRLCHLNLEV